MKVFWWNGGVQIQPESDVETEALLVVMQTIRYERPPETDTPPHGDRGGEMSGGEDYGPQT